MPTIPSFLPAVIAACAFHFAAWTEQRNGHLIFEEGFEGAQPFSKAHNLEVGPWSYGLQYVSEPVHTGRKAARFEIRAEQRLVKNGKRAEAVIIKSEVRREMWYAFSVYFPERGFERDSEREVISQWYQDGSPATSLRVRNDTLFLETGNSVATRKQLNIAPLVKNSWHTCVIHFKHSFTNDGLIELWYDGSKVITHHGGNMYDDVLPKWKIGIYKAAFKHGTSLVRDRIIFFDDIKVGDQQCSYSEIARSN